MSKTNRTIPWSRVALLFLAVRVVIVALALGLMYREGQHQAGPGVWFAVSLVCIAVAVVPWFWESKQ